jgi:hypothetical protein
VYAIEVDGIMYYAKFHSYDVAPRFADANPTLSLFGVLFCRNSAFDECQEELNALLTHINHSERVFGKDIIKCLDNGKYFVKNSDQAKYHLDFHKNGGSRMTCINSQTGMSYVKRNRPEYVYTDFELCEHIPLGALNDFKVECRLVVTREDGSQLLTSLNDTEPFRYPGGTVTVSDFSLRHAMWRLLDEQDLIWVGPENEISMTWHTEGGKPVFKFLFKTDSMPRIGRGTVLKWWNCEIEPFVDEPEPVFVHFGHFERHFLYDQVFSTSVDPELCKIECDARYRDKTTVTGLGLEMMLEFVRQQEMLEQIEDRYRIRDYDDHDDDHDNW